MPRLGEDHPAEEELAELLPRLASPVSVVAAVLAAAHDAIVIQDAFGRIVAANHSAETILGMTREELFGTTSFDREPYSVHEDLSPFPGEDHPGMDTLRTGKPHRDVVMGVYQPDGDLRWIRINTEPVLEPGIDVPAAVVAAFSEIPAPLDTSAGRE